MNSIIEAETFEPETTFENNINEIKYYCMKSVTSLDMNLSAITLEKPLSSSENIKFYLMSCILLKSTENRHNSPIICPS